MVAVTNLLPHRSVLWLGLVSHQPRPGGSDGLMQIGLQGLSGRQHGKVFGDMDATLVQLQQLDLLLLLAGAEDDGQRGILAGLLLMAGPASAGRVPSAPFTRP